MDGKLNCVQLKVHRFEEYLPLLEHQIVLKYIIQGCIAYFVHVQDQVFFGNPPADGLKAEDAVQIPVHHFPNRSTQVDQILSHLN